MLSDSPSNYLREPEMMEFLAPVPTEWDETRVLDGKNRAVCCGGAAEREGLVRGGDDELVAARVGD